MTPDQSAYPNEKGWYSHGYLPHFDGSGVVQTLVLRLHDSMPSHPRPPPATPQFARQVDAVLDAGHGACWLRDPAVADLVERALMHFDGQRYRLIAWCIMPNHVHAMIETLPGYALPSIVHSWKSFTGTAANRLLERKGEFWSREFFDRYVRDDRHFVAARNYIEENPTKAGLVRLPGQWHWSSARYRLVE